MAEDPRTGDQSSSGPQRAYEGGPKRLYRSSDDRMLLGVCGGLGEYFDIDATIIRVVFVIGAFLWLSGVILYAVLAIIMPSEDKLDVHPREAARSTVDEAMIESRRAANRASGWVREKTGKGRT